MSFQTALIFPAIVMYIANTQLRSYMLTINLYAVIKILTLIHCTYVCLILSVWMDALIRNNFLLY